MKTEKIKHFVNQIKSLISVMEHVQATGKKFDMATWCYMDHECGTAACICGWQAIQGFSSELFPRSAKIVNDLRMLPLSAGHPLIKSIASCISGDLEDSCYSLFGSRFLSRSIYAGAQRSRYEAANTHFRLQGESRDSVITKLEGFTHLTAALEETPAAAIEYMQFVVDYLEGLENANDNT